MKVYEKMGIDPTTAEGITAILALNCKDIPDGSNHNGYGGKTCGEIDCSDCIGSRLAADLHTKFVGRYEIYNGNFFKAKEDFNIMCDGRNSCTGCDLRGENGGDCFVAWLVQKIEVEK